MLGTACVLQCASRANGSAVVVVVRDSGGTVRDSGGTEGLETRVVTDVLLRFRGDGGPGNPRRD